MSDERSTVDRVVELAVHVPVGIAAFARDAVPTLVTMFAGRGKREVDVHQREVVGQIANYKAVGELAVKFGPPVVKQRVNEQMITLRARSVEAFESFSTSSRAYTNFSDMCSSDGSSRPEYLEAKSKDAPTEDASTQNIASNTPPSPAPNTEPSTPETDSTAMQPGILSIPDYDGLAASQIIERLEGLNPEELNDVENYERATRARRTVLGKIAILRTK